MNWTRIGPKFVHSWPKNILKLQKETKIKSHQYILYKTVNSQILFFRPLTNYPGDKSNQIRLQNQFMQLSRDLEDLKHFLGDNTPPQILKAALGIIRNLAQNHQILLREKGFVGQILKLFRMHHEKMKESGPLFQLKKDVTILDIFEHCVLCTVYFVRDPTNIGYVMESQAGVIDILTEALLVLLSNPSRNTRKILEVGFILVQF